jgi:hypothetical protein
MPAAKRLILRGKKESLRVARGFTDPATEARAP